MIDNLDIDHLGIDNLGIACSRTHITGVRIQSMIVLVSGVTYLSFMSSGINVNSR